MNKTCFNCAYSHLFEEELKCSLSSKTNDGSDYKIVKENDIGKKKGSINNMFVITLKQLIQFSLLGASLFGLLILILYYWIKGKIKNRKR